VQQDQHHEERAGDDQQHVEDDLDHDFSRLGGRQKNTGLWSASVTDARRCSRGCQRTPAVARS
jgi:hypothetical protein